MDDGTLQAIVEAEERNLEDVRGEADPAEVAVMEGRIVGLREEISKREAVNRNGERMLAAVQSAEVPGVDWDDGSRDASTEQDIQIEIATGDRFDVHSYLGNHNGQLIQDIKNRLADVRDMSPVYNLEGNEFQKSAQDGRKLSEKIQTFFRSLGNRVFRKGFGKVALNDAGIHDSIGHGVGKIKAAAFAAVPSVIQEGKLYDLGKYADHQYDTYLFLAPVTFQGAEDASFYVGAYVIKDAGTQRYKMHEVLAITKEGVASFQTETNQNDSLLRETTPSDSMISQTQRDVKEADVPGVDYDDGSQYGAGGQAAGATEGGRPMTAPAETGERIAAASGLAMTNNEGGLSNARQTGEGADRGAKGRAGTAGPVSLSAGERGGNGRGRS